MSSLRYSFSFIISSMLYAGLGFSLLTLIEQPKVFKKEPEKIIKIAIITPVLPKVVAPPIVAPTPPVVVPPKKIIKKKVVKKVKPKKIVKKVIKKIVPKPQPIIEEVYKEVFVDENSYVSITPTPIKAVTKKALQSPVASPTVNLDAKKRTFLNGVRRSIHAHKKYPKMAKRRNLQGSVHAIFDIQSNGTVSNIQLSGASTVLQKAVRKSILRSFPIAIPSELSSKFPMYSVSIDVNFVLE